MEAGADINAYSGKFKGSAGTELTPLQAAASRGDYELVVLLVKRGADVNKPASGNSGRTALQAACEWDPVSAEEGTRKTSLIKFLLRNDADVNAPPSLTQYSFTALQLAALHGFIEVAVLLLSHKADPNALPSGVGPYGTLSALDLAATFGRLDMVKFLLNAGALSYDRGLNGYDGAIRAAKEEGNFPVVNLIYKHIEDDIALFGANPAHPGI